MLLRLGLEIADRIVAALPSGFTYALADLAGDVWYRLAPSRRRRVAANLARVCAATGRAAAGGSFAALVRSAFRHHARYYVELLRSPHYPAEGIARIVECPDWDTYAAALVPGPGMFISGHVGNFEPFGTYVGVMGMRPLCPIEEIEPRPLFEFLAQRRGGGAVDLVPLRRSGRALHRRLKDGGLVGIIADRDLRGGGQEVMIFGHPTTFPTGPAALAVTHRASIVAGRCLRTGPDRFRAEGEVIEPPSSGDRPADVATLTAQLAARIERDIAAAPEQWWGAFQPFWPDLDA